MKHPPGTPGRLELAAALLALGIALGIMIGRAEPPTGHPNPCPATITPHRGDI